MADHGIRRKLSSLQGRLVLLVWCLTAASMVFYVAFDVISQRRSAQANAVGAMEGFARVLAYDLSAGVAFQAEESIQETLEGAFLIQGITFAAAYDKEGGGLVRLGDADRGRCGVACHVGVMETQETAGALLVHSPITSSQDEVIGTLVLERSLRDVVAATRRRILVSLAFLAAILSAGLAAAIVFANRISRPIMGLAEAAKGFADGEDPREKLDGGGIHEVEALAETFTSMFARTQKHRLLIEEQNRTLEAKVLERTEELRQKNLALAFQNEKVLEASRLKSQFLANVSHELRTPLNGVLALSEMLKEKLSGPLNEEQMEHVLLIHKSGATLLSLINEILDLSRVESGHLEVTPRNVKILEFLKGEAESLRVLADAKGLKFEVVAQTRDEAEVSVDPDRIRQVMVNLIGNALKFTDNGVVRVILEKIHEGSTLRVTVQDTGIGIPDEHHATIFQEFRQVDGSATRRHGGTGLGLAIGRKLVNLMGGEIWVNSVKDRGSTFSFVVPLATGRWPAATVGRVVAGTSSRHRDAGDGDHVPQVLIVEDDQVETSLMSRDLRRRGIDVLMAFDGDEALRVLRGSSPDLILLDLLLPRIDGFGFLESLSIIPGAADIPIVVNTAKVLSDQERRFLESRVRAVHIKGGTDPNRLLQEIQEILGREAVEREKPAAA